MMAVPLMIIATGLSVVSAISQANAKASAAEYNQKVGNANAITAEQQAGVQAGQQMRRASMQQGQMLAAFAANGVSTSEGSALDIMAQSARDAEVDKQTILYNGQVKATNFRNGAQLSGMEADSAMSNGYMSAAGALIGGSAGAYGAYQAGLKKEGSTIKVD